MWLPLPATYTFGPISYAKFCEPCQSDPPKLEPSHPLELTNQISLDPSSPITIKLPLNNMFPTRWAPILTCSTLPADKDSTWKGQLTRQGLQVAISLPYTLRNLLPQQPSPLYLSSQHRSPQDISNSIAPYFTFFLKLTHPTVSCYNSPFEHADSHLYRIVQRLY